MSDSEQDDRDNLLMVQHPLRPAGAAERSSANKSKDGEPGVHLISEQDIERLQKAVSTSEALPKEDRSPEHAQLLEASETFLLRGGWGLSDLEKTDQVLPPKMIETLPEGEVVEGHHLASGTDMVNRAVNQPTQKKEESEVVTKPEQVLQSSQKWSVSESFVMPIQLMGDIQDSIRELSQLSEDGSDNDEARAALVNLIDQMEAILDHVGESERMKALINSDRNETETDLE